MIILFTDFGDSGPYVGQMKAVLAQYAPAVPVIDLLNDAPQFDVTASAHLLAAYADSFPADSIFLGVVDPTVGSEQRRPVIVKVDGRYFVGPDNGLFNVVAARGSDAQWWEISWRPDHLSASFHGRDLFAPVAAQLACGEMPSVTAIASHIPSSAADDLYRIVYIDHYGNAITGIRAKMLEVSASLLVAETLLTHARTFADVPLGQAMWYENANGLVEIAVNQGHAEDLLRLKLGDSVTIVSRSG
jgi:S-adenosylmethionine hydrolase